MGKTLALTLAVRCPPSRLEVLQAGLMTEASGSWARTFRGLTAAWGGRWASGALPRVWAPCLVLVGTPLGTSRNKSVL